MIRFGSFTVAICIAFALVPSVYSEIMIISPVSGANTTNSDILVGWTDFPANFSTYRVLISTDKDFSKKSEIESTTAYSTFRNLDSGLYYLKVQVIGEGHILDESKAATVRVNERPQFGISVDTSEYSAGHVVIFRINAPLGSAVDLLVDGDQDGLSYHPASLKTKEFRTVLEPGDYSIDSNLTYFDYFTNFKSVFSLIGQSAPPANEDEADDNDTRMYKLNLTTLDDKGERLPLVLFNTMTVDTKSVFFYNETDVTGTDGVRLLLLPAETYLLELSKKGYKSTTKVVDLDYENVSLTVTLEPDDAPQLEDYEIDIISPHQDERVENKHVNLKVSVNGGFDSCQLLYTNGNGWKVAGNPVEGEQIFSLTKAEPGRYRAKIECKFELSNYSSDEIEFTVYSPLNDDSLIQPMLTEIDEAKKNVNIINDDSVIDYFNFLGSLNSAEDELKGLNEEYNRLLNKGADDSSIQGQKEKIGKRVTELRNELPVSVEMGNSEDHAVYLPVSGFEELYKKYKEAGGSTPTKSEITHQKSAQEDFIVKNTLNHLVVKRMSGVEEVYSVVSETISSFGETVPEKKVVYIDNGLEFTGVEFLTDTTKIGGNFYEVKGDQVKFFFREDIDLEMAKGVKTMIIAPDSGQADSPTGFAISDLASSAKPSYFAVLGIILIALFGGYAVSKGNKKKSISKLTGNIHLALNHLERGEHAKAFSFYPNILKLHKKLAPEKKEEFSSIMLYLHGQLEEHNLSLMLTTLDKTAAGLAAGFDENTFNNFIELFNKATLSYNGLDENLKSKYFDRINNFHSIINEIQQIG